MASRQVLVSRRYRGAVTALLFTASLAVSNLVSGNPQVNAGTSNPENHPHPVGVKQDWYSQVQKDIQESEYQIRWQDSAPIDELKGSYQAPNRNHNFRTYFTKDGIRVILRDATDKKNISWQWGITLRSYGVEVNLEPVEESALHVENNEIPERGYGFMRLKTISILLMQS